MKTSIEFLPVYKQNELKKITELIVNKHHKVNMVILFGSYARNTWIEDLYTVENGTTYSYISDYDILVVMSSENAARRSGFQQTLQKEIAESGIETPVSLIFHGYDYICAMLSESRYFFCDIYYEGIILANPWEREFKEPKEISYALRVEKSKEYFEEWFGTATSFFEHYRIGMEKGKTDKKQYKIASFHLHQSAERFYMCALLVFTDYKEKTHDLEILDKACRDEDSRFREVFPRQTKEEDDLFELLREAYIGSRYKMDFKVTKEELEYLEKRVEILMDLTEKICKEKIEKFIEMAKKYPEKTIESKRSIAKDMNNGSKVRRIDNNKINKGSIRDAREIGELIGVEKGKLFEKLEIARNLLDILDVETIALKVGLTVEEIEKLKTKE